MLSIESLVGLPIRLRSTAGAGEPPQSRPTSPLARISESPASEWRRPSRGASSVRRPPHSAPEPHPRPVWFHGRRAAGNPSPPRPPPTPPLLCAAGRGSAFSLPRSVCRTLGGRRHRARGSRDLAGTRGLADARDHTDALDLTALDLTGASDLTEGNRARARPLLPPRAPAAAPRPAPRECSGTHVDLTAGVGPARRHALRVHDRGLPIGSAGRYRVGPAAAG